jgi:hypothetical protein
MDGGLFSEALEKAVTVSSTPSALRAAQWEKKLFRFPFSVVAEVFV